MSLMRLWTFRFLVVSFCLLTCSSASASCGEVYYGMTSQGLVSMSEFIMMIMVYVKYLLHAIGCLVCFYSITAIYAKIQNGEDGFNKSIQMLVGAIFFMFAIEIIFPAFFGFSMS